MRSIDPGILPQSVCFPFTPPDLAKKMLFYATWCGHYYCTKNYCIDRETYAPLLLVYVRDGVFHMRYRGERFEARRGDVVLLDCTEPHYYQAEDGLEFLYVHFDGSNAHELCQHILAQTGPLMRRPANVTIGRELYDMVDFYDHDGSESMFDSSLRIYRLLHMLATPDPETQRADHPIKRSIDYIRSNIGQPITLEQLAGIANFSTFYFSHSFKKQTGFSPMEYVINTRVERAKSLLIRTGLSVAEIADQVGYASSSSLINLFDKRVGLSPTEYRRLHVMTAK